jgi:hypothetical protein
VTFTAEADGLLCVCVDASTTTVALHGGPVYGAVREVAGSIAAQDREIAANQHSVGDLLTVGGTLYKATQAIAAGETITPGTNVAETTMAEELSAEITARATSIASETANRERVDDVLRGALGLMDYRGEDADYTEVPGATNASCIGAVVRGEMVTLNGTNNATGSIYLRMSGNCSKVASATTVRGWEGTFTSLAGHLIRCTLTLISGTIDGAVTVSFYKSGAASNTVGTMTRHDSTIYQREWTSDGDPISVVLLVGKDAVLTNVKLRLVMQDITACLDGGVVAVSGTTPTIAAVSGMRYECGTVTELSFTPASSGLCEVGFASGSTPTVLTLPSTVRMPDWWTGVEANRTYDLMILNGTLAGVMSWAT